MQQHSKGEELNYMGGRNIKELWASARIGTVISKCVGRGLSRCANIPCVCKVAPLILCPSKAFFLPFAAQETSDLFLDRYNGVKRRRQRFSCGGGVMDRFLTPITARVSGLVRFVFAHREAWARSFPATCPLTSPGPSCCWHLGDRASLAWLLPW